MDLNDKTLTESGLPLDKSRGRVLLIACGALAREIVDLKARNSWEHLDLTCLPAILHNYPEKITSAVESAVAKYRDAYETVFVVYADCGTGGHLQAACEKMGVEMIKGPHCYSFFEGNERFAEHGETEITSFYLTDFLARQFDAFIWKPLGMNKHPELVDMYFAHYTKLVYQAQTDDAALTERAREIASRLNLAFERRFTGYGDLEATLKSLTTR